MLRNLFGHKFSPEPWIETARGSVLIGEISPKEALKEWERRRESWSKTGMWPLILGDESDRDLRRELFADFGDAYEETVAQGLALDFDRLVQERLDDATSFEDASELDLDFEPSLLTAPKAPAWPDGLHVLREKGPFFLALLPVRAPYEVPALLPFGDWNACPTNDRHVAFLRHWQEEFGAEPAVMTHDVLELRIARPIDDPVVAKRVALQHFAYASEVVTQGAGTLRLRAQELLGAESWTFWWD